MGVPSSTEHSGNMGIPSSTEHSGKLMHASTNKSQTSLLEVAKRSGSSLEGYHSVDDNVCSV
eukprot:5488784-Karenia_brevis.AAC.1